MKRNLVIFIFGILASATAATGAVPPGTNPHGDTQKCDACHVASSSELKDPSVKADRKKLLTGGANGVCTQCHAVSLGHGVGKKPARNIHGLPLTGEGTIACAVTCHNIHLAKPESAAQKRFFLRLPPQKLCASCHDE